MSTDFYVQSKKAIYIIISTFLSVLYIFSYLNIPNDILRDRFNYIVYASNYEIIHEMRMGEGFIFNEPLFIYINKFSSMFFVPEHIPLFFVFINSVILMWLLVEKSKNILFFLLGFSLVLFVPYVFQSQIITLRQALATSVFLMAFFYLKDNWKIFIVSLICCLIHSVFFIIALFYFLNFILLKKLTFELKMIINFFMMLSISLGFILITQYLGVRQANSYSDVEINVGGGAFLLFLGIFITLYTQRKKYNNEHFTFLMGGIVLFLVGYFLGPLSGRLFNTFFPFIVLFLVSVNSYLSLSIMLLLSFVYGFLYFNGGYNALLEYPYNSFTEFFSNINYLM